MKTFNYFDNEKVTIDGFFDFCKKNIPLLICVTIALIFSYGVKLCFYSIGIDTELFMASNRNMGWETKGRFGLVLLQKIWSIKEFNPFTSFFITLCFIWLFTISWCYIISIFSKNTNRNNKLIPFALLFMTMPIWAEQFYFVLQSAETSFIVFLCPYIIYSLYIGILNNEKLKVVLGFILLIFITSVYQGVVPLFFCGVFACFILFHENSDYDPELYQKLFLKLCFISISALLSYFFIDKIIVSFIFNAEKSEYLNNMNQWGKEPIKKNIMNILLYIYTITIGHISLVQTIMEPIITKYSKTGIQAARAISNASNSSGNILLMPATILFIAQIVKISKKIIPTKIRFIYFLSGISIPISIILLSILGGNKPPIRSLFVLPFALSFMVFFLISKYNKRFSSIIVYLVIIVSVFQAQITSQLFYSDYIRYQNDIHIAREIERIVALNQNIKDENKPTLVIIGKYQISSMSKDNFIEGEVIGHSFFESIGDEDKFSPTKRGLAFMRLLGINYSVPNKSQMDEAYKFSKSMPSYPDLTCIKKLKDFIIVKL